MGKRVFILVMDSFGIGEAPDAADFGDVGANTIASVACSTRFNAPTLTEMGLFNIEGVDCREGTANPTGSFGRLREASRGKDTTIGHWEIAGIISKKAMPTFPDGFPKDFIDAFEKAVGRKTVCNMPYSGTEVIKQYGEGHLKTGDLIVYTSADSVFQIAAHEEKVPLSELYDICRTARKLLNDMGYPVGRVIARPFVGTNKDNFSRTTNRHDFSLTPPKNTMLDYICKAGQSVIAVGKINDIFAGVGVSEKTTTKGNKDGMRVAAEYQSKDFDGLCFVNLVDFDMLYGHRNDIDGYAAAISELDAELKGFIANMKKDDLLIITADHGCDPGFTASTDHSREYVPMLAYGAKIKSGVDLKTRDSFADIAATVCDYLNVKADIEGTSFWEKIKA